ncbi:enoyl-CoA hydratase [Duganella sp. sic0402]|uniref:enoyl-CoA hydratase n=1 Tax=Duganella sp. sic0402 TaxID=2854786 RepID=UPI001C4446FE|nr:enoyl-CoA hydratase [Duganella sp. sic0402]MBV7538425.1 enoyl-CoA hydratase [Duganella sp. sic0402]
MEILNSIDNGILTLEFNRPERKNAITAAMYQAMADALTAAETDTAVRAILLVGKPEIFTAGNDLEDFMKNAPTSGAIEDRSVYKFMMALSGATKPVVAAVAGNAVGIGTTLLMHCDLVYAADNAKFSMPFVQLGLCPEFGSSLLLTQIAGYPRAAEKLMLGEAFGAQEALEIGLISKVLPVDELRAFAEGQAAKLVALPASSIRVTKELMKAARKAPTSEAIAAENIHFGKMLSSPEAKEAFMAFFQKRKPDFTQFA